MPPPTKLCYLSLTSRNFSLTRNTKNYTDYLHKGRGRKKYLRIRAEDSGVRFTCGQQGVNGLRDFQLSLFNPNREPPSQRCSEALAGSHGRAPTAAAPTARAPIAGSLAPGCPLESNQRRHPTQQAGPQRSCKTKIEALPFKSHSVVPPSHPGPSLIFNS